MKTVADELEQKTQEYWRVSKVFYKGVGVPMSMRDAIKFCNDAVEELGPQRSLKYRLFSFQDRLIQGRFKRRKTPKYPDNVRDLESVRKLHRQTKSAIAQ